MNDHFRPVAKPAPPRPRWPEALHSLTSPSRPLARISLVPSQAPRARAPLRRQSCCPYRFLKMRSLSASMVLLAPRIGGIGDRRFRDRGLVHVGGLAGLFRFAVGTVALAFAALARIQRRIGQRIRPADRSGIDAVDLRPRFH